MPEDSLALIGMPDIKLLYRQKIICEVMEDHMKTGALTPRQCKDQKTLVAKQTKPNRSRLIMQVLMILMQTCQIISGLESTE